MTSATYDIENEYEEGLEEPLDFSGATSGEER